MTECIENQIVPPRSCFLTSNIINGSLWLLCGNKEREIRKCLLLDIYFYFSGEHNERCIKGSGISVLEWRWRWRWRWGDNKIPSIDQPSLAGMRERDKYQSVMAWTCPALI